MERRTMLTSLMGMATLVALASCKKEAGDRDTAPEREKAPKSFVVRLTQDATNKNKISVDMVAADSDLKNASKEQVISSFDKGQALNLTEQNNGVLGTDAARNSFALNGCQGYNVPMGSYQYPQTGAIPFGAPMNQNNNILGGILGGGFGGIIGNLVRGIFGGNVSAVPTSSGGLFGILSQLFTSNSFMPVALPYGQNGYQYGCGYQNPYGQNYGQPYPGAGQPIPQQPTQPGYGPMPYPYMGQYQQGPYTYYTYGQQPGYQPNMQPVPGQPIPQQGYQQQPYPQQGGYYPNGAPQGGDYTYTPYPTGYAYGAPTP